MHYDYECECGEIFDDFRPVEERHVSVCPKCGKMAKLLFRPLSLSAAGQQFVPYVDEHLSPDGNPILVESRAQKRDLMKRQGLEDMPSVRWV